MSAKTSQEWWDGIKQNPAAIIDWLTNQYHGEKTAATRLIQFTRTYGSTMTTDQMFKIGVITGQEMKHAEWIGELLKARGVEPKLLVKSERYWDQTLGGIDSFETGCAVAAHAETMRLERIRAIVADDFTHEDIQAVFAKILTEEEFHAATFRSFTTEAALSKTNQAHIQGLNALGLII